MTDFIGKKFLDKLKTLWWLFGILAVIFGWYFTAKSTVIMASESAKKIVELDTRVIDLETCKKVQEVKNTQYEQAIMDSKVMFREIRDELRMMRRK